MRYPYYSKQASKRTLSIATCLFAVGIAGQAQAQAQAPASNGRMLVQFQRGVRPDHIQALFNEQGMRKVGEIPQLGVHVVQLPPKANAMAMARAFGQRAGVVFAEPDYVVAPDQTATPMSANDPYFGSAWHLNKMSCPTAWTTTTGSSSIIVAILDTGCDPTHPDLAPKYVPGWNTYDNTADTSDVYGHGTATAGTAAAASNNGAGVTSIAWNCRIMPIRISDTAGMGYSSTVSAGLTWAADHGARVANISYQLDQSASVQSAAQYFMSRGGVVTMSAGNSGQLLTSVDTPYIITVSATDANDVLASWSNRGPDVDLSAPGVGIWTTSRGGLYGSWSGTSFSAPATAGVAALILSANPSLTGSQVETILKQSADDLGTAGYDTSYGWGRVNAARAVAMAMNTAGYVDTTAPAVNFLSPGNGGTVAGTTSVQIAASDTGGIASIMLSLDGVQIGSYSSSSATWTWNTTAATNGTHTLTAIGTDASGNKATTSITVTVYNAPDTSAPTVSITSPTGGKMGVNLTVSTNSADNRGVVKVELWANGKIVQTDTSAPWTFSINTKKWSAGSYALQCIAYDAAGNKGVSQIVTITK